MLKGIKKMRDKEKEILNALVPENKEVNEKKPRRSRRRFGVGSYIYSQTIPSPFTIKFPN